MNNFMINFDANTRVQEIKNASTSLYLRANELHNRKPKSIQEALVITEEMTQIAADMEKYEAEIKEITNAKLNSMLGNIDRMTK